MVKEGPIHVLIVDDQEAIRELCAEITGSLGFRVSSVDDGAAALRICELDHVDILLADLKMPGMTGIELLEGIKDVSPETEVVVMTAFGSVASAVEAMRQGAFDYLTKPFNLEEMKLLFERLVRKLDLENENRVLREQVRQGGFYRLMGTSPPMQKLFRMIAKVSQNHYPVLIHGESGTGKELVARSIHESGPWASKPFLPIDCGSLVPTLIESELFGYARGAFTGAVRTKEGLLEAAGNGTVFLDEIGEMPVDLQSKFLRALQEKEVRPIGGSRRVKIEARVIAATNRELEAAVEQGTFRKDLYFRLNVVGLRLPPLRERKSDIPLLVNHFIDKFRSPSRPRPTVSDHAMERLLAYDWPGNVRELENCIERAVALGSGPVLQSGDLTTNLQYGRGSTTGKLNARAATADAGSGARSSAGPAQAYAGAGAANAFVPVFSRLPMGSSSPTPRAALDGAGDHAALQERIVPLAELERQAILNAVQEAGGDKLLAARLLGIGKTTLYRKLKEYGSS